MTSSAASEADSARKSVSGASSAAPRMTATPPPSGMWTSSRTTSGRCGDDERDGLRDARGLAHELDVALELGAHAGAEEPVVVDDRDARHAVPGHGELDLGPGAGRRVDRGAPAVAGHAPDDRLAHAAAVVGDGGRIEARAAVAHEDLQRVVGRLGVDVDRRAAAELRRVDHRLARGGDERLAAPVERRGRRRRRPRPARRGRARPRRPPPRARRRARSWSPSRAGQPRAQLALLRAGQRGHRARVVGALLHERERLQHRVVQVRRHLGALLRADALLALGGQRAHEPDGPRREDDPEHDGHDEHGEDDVARGGQRVRRRRGRRCRRR